MDRLARRIVGDAAAGRAGAEAEQRRAVDRQVAAFDADRVARADVADEVERTARRRPGLDGRAARRTARLDDARHHAQALLHEAVEVGDGRRGIDRQLQRRLPAAATGAFEREHVADGKEVRRRVVLHRGERRRGRDRATAGEELDGGVEHARPAADVAAGVEVAAEEGVPRRLGFGQAADGNVEVDELAGSDVFFGIDGKALDVLAAGGDEVVAAVEAEAAVAGVVLFFATDDEEPVAVDREVRRPAGGFDAAAGPVLLDAGDAGTEAALVRVASAGLAARRAAAGISYVELRLEQGTASLEADRVHVGDVVADDVEPRLVDVEAAESGEERAGECHELMSKVVRICTRRKERK